MYATDDIGLLWNSLPRSITDINSHVVFNKKLKCYLSENISLWLYFTNSICGLMCGDVILVTIVFFVFFCCYFMYNNVFCFFSVFLCLSLFVSSPVSFYFWWPALMGFSVVITPPRRSGMARVLKESHSFTCTPRVHPLRIEPLPSQPKLQA